MECVKIMYVIKEVTMKLEVMKLNEAAKLPTKNHITDTGIDLYAVEDVLFQPNERKLVGTGIAITFPDGFGGELRGRSGLSAKTGMTVIHGTIDQEYRGEIKVIMHNFGDTYQVRAGDRIAQLVLEKVYPVDIIESHDIQLDTNRGIAGFGSSGK